MEDENDPEPTAIYEDEVLEIISLSDGEEDHRIEDVEEDMNEIQLDEDDDLDSESEEEVTVTTFKPIRDDAAGCFTAHKGPVFTVSLDHTSSLVCTGGQDDRGFVWRLSDMKIMFECTGHKDSVTCSGFSHDDKYLCTTDLSGLVQIWQITDGQVVWSFETSQVEWVVWHPQAHILLCGTSDGEAWLWRIPSGDCKTLPSSGYGNMAGTLLPDGKRLCCGYFDGTLKMWDLKTAAQIYSLTNQTSPVTCLSCHSDGNRLIVGYMNGTSQLVSTNEAKVLAMLTVANSLHPSDDDSETNATSVESVAFAPGQHLGFVAKVTGVLTAWDLATKKIRYYSKPQVPNCGIVKLIVSESSPILYTCHLDGVVRKYDMMSGACQREWHGHSAGILDMALTRDETRLITTSDDGSVRIYDNTDHASTM